MTGEILLSCNSCESGVFHVKDNEMDEVLTIVCSVCGEVRGTIRMANTPGTDECEGCKELDIEGVNW